MQFMYPDSNDDQPTVAPAQRHDLAIKILSFLTPALGLLLLLLGSTAKFSWLTQPWVRDCLIALGVVTVFWFAWPRFSLWLRKYKQKRRDQRFIYDNELRLREFVERFAEFISNDNTQSLIYIVRAAYSQNVTAVEQVFQVGYIGSWFQCFREQLSFRTDVLAPFLARCREFTSIVQQFNTYYVQRAHAHLGTAQLPDHSVEELEAFREEYNAFLRDLSPWSKAVANYLQSEGVADQPTLWQLAPTSYFEKAKSFGRTKSAGG
jgi:hypothetical protein